jgi:uroporphyrinogen-III synthase
MKRVAITTDRFAETAPVFTAAGLEPISLPCIAVRPESVDQIAKARIAAASAELLLLTSTRAVEVLWPDSMPALDVAAVGRATARLVNARGGRVVCEGRGGVDDLMTKLRPSGIRAIYPHGTLVEPKALAALTAHYPNMRDFVVYRTEPVAPAAEEVGAVAFSSPSAVNGWLLTRELDGLVVGVIGETTRRAVVAHHPVDVVAPQPTHDSLARALAEFLEAAA